MFTHDDVGFAVGQAAAGIFDHGKRFGQNFLQRGGEFVFVLDFGQLRLPIGGFLTEFVVGKLLQSGFKVVDLLDARPEFLHFAVVARPEQFFNEPNHDNF